MQNCAVYAIFDPNVNSFTLEVHAMLLKGNVQTPVLVLKNDIYIDVLFIVYFWGVALKRGGSTNESSVHILLHLKFFTT